MKLFIANVALILSYLATTKVYNKVFPICMAIIYLIVAIVLLLSGI